MNGILTAAGVPFGGGSIAFFVCNLKPVAFGSMHATKLPSYSSGYR